MLRLTQISFALSLVGLFIGLKCNASFITGFALLNIGLWGTEFFIELRKGE